MRNALLVGTNQTRFLIWGTLAEASVNIFLDYTLIYGKLGFPALGFNGAAYASIVAEGAGLLVIYLVIHKKNIHKTFAFFEQTNIDFSVMKLILTISTPLILQFAISIMSWEFFYILIEHHGPRALAISNTMRNIFGLFGVFCWAFAATANTMVSNIIGQGRQDEVMPLIKRIVQLSLGISLFIFVLLNSVPAFFLQIYGQGDAFIAEAIPIVRIVSVALLMMSVGTIWLNAVTGTGNSRVNLLIEFITIVIYCVYVYFVLERWNLSIRWGWGSEWVYWLSMFMMAYFYMKSGKWRDKQI
ncbi:MAG: MATE family efflux transporter [Cytophagales bacterium]|nr:MATE family efflux transporter [Cytophagales bacterium]